MLSTSCAPPRRCCCCRSCWHWPPAARHRRRRARPPRHRRRVPCLCRQRRPSCSAEGHRKHGFEVVAEFDAPGGLRGFAGVVGGQQPAAAYVTADGKHVLVGSLFDAEGNDVAAEAVEKLVATPMSAKMWTKLEASAWVRDGKADAPRVIYTFSDANCPYCHKFWEAARPWVDAGKVQLRHIMVGVIREDSPARPPPSSPRVIRARRCWRTNTSSTVAASRRCRTSAARSQASLMPTRS